MTGGIKNPMLTEQLIADVLEALKASKMRSSSRGAIAHEICKRGDRDYARWSWGDLEATVSRALRALLCRQQVTLKNQRWMVADKQALIPGTTPAER